MCGIAGFVLASAPLDAEARLVRMTDAVRHRGPDGEGFSLHNLSGGGLVGLGHRRLAIIDLTTGQQPIYHQGAGVTLVFNGEIYNFQSLRRELEAKGHAFRTTSDTEVLLNCYVEWGPDCVARLRGMFAFAIWDAPCRRLMLARDPFGKKPLFLYEDKGRLLFASEIKSILAFGEVTPALDRASVADYLSWRYVPGPYTLFAGVRKLRPGSFALWAEGRLVERIWFIPPDGLADPGSPPVGDPIVAFTQVLDEAVRLRMISDVPYGAFLSGGLDSSAMVALMSRHSGQAVNTFSIGFREARYSELPYARQIAKRFRTNHTEVVVSADELMEHLPLLIHHSDAPVAEVSNVPIYLISREAAKSVKMVLTGEGSDEFLGGYPKHSAERLVAAYQAVVPQCAHERLIRPLLQVLPFGFHRIKTIAATIGLRDASERMSRWLGALSFEERARLLAADAPLRTPDPRPFAVAPRSSALKRILHFDQTSWLPDNLLERGDRITMAVSIEARMPFIDKELASFVARLPDRWRIRGLTQKYILRRAMQDVLPAEILSRPKVGFRVPVNEWFRGPMRGFVRDHLDSAASLTAGLYRRERLRAVLDEHEGGRQNHEKLIWTLTNLELFQRRFRLT